MRRGWHWTALTLVHGRAGTRGERVAWTRKGHTRAYGVLTSKAFEVDTTTVRRAATKNSFIVVP